MTTNDTRWADTLREIAAELATLADGSAAAAARDLGPMLARGSGIEKRLAQARIAAVREVVAQAGTQHAAADLIGISQPQINRLANGLSTPHARAKAGQRV